MGRFLRSRGRRGPKWVSRLGGASRQRGREVARPQARRWLAPASRCLVSFTSFSETARRLDGKYEPVVFPVKQLHSADDSRSLRLGSCHKLALPRLKTCLECRASVEEG
jgi:hypothetical protein